MASPARKAKVIPPYPKRRGAGALESFVHAWNGLIHTVVHQRNMRVHVTSGLLVGLVGSGLPLGLAEKVTLIFCVLLVFFAEILNSALEQLVDLAIQQFDEKARVTKDAAAAGVLVLAFGTVVIFAAVLVHNWETITAQVPRIQRQVLFGVPLTGCVMALMFPSRRPAALDVLFFVVGVGLIATLFTWSTSYVFSAMTLGMLIIAAASSYARRHGVT